MAFCLEVLSIRITIFCVGVCLYLFVIFPGQTGTATSSPNEKTPFRYFRALVKGKDVK